jgi:ribosomal protein S27E
MAAPANLPVACPSCGASFPFAAAELAALQACPRCAKPTRVILFPAYDRAPEMGQVAETVVMEGEATCFYHPQKRAHVPCDSCGRFLCAMCDLDMGGRHLCPQCVDAGVKKGKVQSLERGRTRWDLIISSTLFLPLVLCYMVAPLSSLVALVFIVWKWKAPPSQVVNTRVRLGVYTVVALVEFIGSVAIWWFLMTSMRHAMHPAGVTH